MKVVLETQCGATQEIELKEMVKSVRVPLIHNTDLSRYFDLLDYYSDKWQAPLYRERVVSD